MKVPRPTSDISDRPETNRGHVLPPVSGMAKPRRFLSFISQLRGHLAESVAHN